MRLLGTPKNILDVGCGAGTIAEYAEEMRKNGCKIMGIDINPKSAEEARKYYEDVIIGDIESLEEIPYETKYFDAMLFVSVLEQLKDPLNALVKFKKWLKDDGKIFIVIENAAHWSMRLRFLIGRIEYVNTGIWCWPKIRFFNKKSAMKLVSNAGLEIINLDVSPAFLLGGIRLRKKMRDKISKLPNKFLRIFGWFLVACLEIDYLVSKLWPQLFAIHFIMMTKKSETTPNL